MKMTSKQFLALVSTTLLTIGALSIAIRTFSFKDREFKYRPFFRNKTEYDVLFFGTSHVINGVFPMQLWHDWGITSYNFGEHGTPIPTSYWVMRNAVRYHKPKIAVLDINSIVENVPYIESWLRLSLGTFPLNLEKLRAIRDLTKPTDYMKFLFPYETYHNRWKEMSIADRWDSLFHTDSTHEMGADSRSLVAKPAAVSLKSDNPLEKKTVSMEYIKKFVFFCRENNIVPILINIPYPADEQQQRGANSARILAEELDVPYYNMLHMNIVDYDTDLSDPDSHLNPSGAYKVTEYIGQVLHDDFNVEDHRPDADYENWNEFYNSYREFLVENFYAHNNFKERLMLLTTSNFSAHIFLSEGTVLDDVEQKLLKQVEDSVTIEYVPHLKNNAKTLIHFQDKATGKEDDFYL
ncbi:MAG: hypothetical protein II921_04715 [Treponema sp.]|nr:hypothetical protein [Treponema sp.]